MQRRHFLQLGAAAIASAPATSSFSTASAREPIRRSGPPRFHLGLAAYSLRQYFSYQKGKAKTPADDGPALDMPAFFDYCSRNGFDAAEPTSYFFKPDADDAYFRELKRDAYLKGVVLSGTAIGNNFTVGKGPKLDEEIAAAKSWIDRASVLGVPHIRFFAGTASQLDGNPRRLAEASDALRHCADHAAAKGIFIGVENHGRLTAEQMLEIMDEIDNPWVGINLDTGNFVSDDPYRDLQQCVDYAVNVQVKVNMKSPEGKHYPADFQRIATILRDANYQGFVILEYEDSKPYENIPKTLEALRGALNS